MKGLNSSLAGSDRAVENRLIEVAGEIFGEKGFRSATIREITFRAGANVAAVNYYFRDKEELYAAALRHAIQASARQDMAIDESLPPEEQLYYFVLERLRHLLDPARPKWHGQIVAREMSSPTRSLDLVVRELILPRVEIFRRIVSAIAGRKLPERRLAMLLLSVIAQCAYYRQSAPIIETLFPDLMKGPGVIDEIARHIAAFSIAGIHACGQRKS